MNYQKRVYNWLMECFSMTICRDQLERSYRFLEETLELVQCIGCSKEDAYKLVDYVYDRPLGELKQEVGGVMVTIAALCSALDIDMQDCAEEELDNCWQKIDKIRKKNAAKQANSALPGNLI